MREGLVGAIVGLESRSCFMSSALPLLPLHLVRSPPVCCYTVAAAGPPLSTFPTFCLTPATFPCICRVPAP